jgi:LuxR family maltose regulon positive regulatory protein
MNGDIAGAARWADNFTAPVPDQPWIWQDPPHRTRARILLTRGTASDLRAAQEIVDALAAVARRHHNRRLLIDVLAVQAWVLHAEGQACRARDALQAATDLAQPGGFVRTFLDLDLRVPEAFSPSVYQAVDDDPGAARDCNLPPVVETLTARELEVLALLHAPISLKEMAGRLCISYLTVRRHTANIYGKLGVNKRQTAVARATALGLIPRS